MLIGFCGAGGTGKTTTAKMLAAVLCLPFVASSSRAVFKRRGLIEADQSRMTPEEQWELQQEIFSEREQLEAVTFEGVADRTLYDQVAYNLLRAPSVIDSKRLDDLVNRARDSVRKYNHLFYFPLVTFYGHDDGMRENNYGVRVNFDAILTWLTRESCINVTRVPVMNLTERVEWIRRVLK